MHATCVPSKHYSMAFGVPQAASLHRVLDQVQHALLAEVAAVLTVLQHASRAIALPGRGMPARKECMLQLYSGLAEAVLKAAVPSRLEDKRAAPLLHCSFGYLVQHVGAVYQLASTRCVGQAWLGTQGHAGRCTRNQHDQLHQSSVRPQQLQRHASCSRLTTVSKGTA